MKETYLSIFQKFWGHSQGQQVLSKKAKGECFEVPDPIVKWDQRLQWLLFFCWDALTDRRMKS